MHIDMIINRKSTRIGAILSLCSLGLCFTACDSGELPGNGIDPANGGLRFTASISDSPATRTSVGATLLSGTAFPDGAHTFGMFITDGVGSALPPAAADNMKTTLTVTGTAEAWTYTDKDGSPLTLNAKPGDPVDIVGYYPWVTGATAAAVPFDLSGDMVGKKDLFYLSSPTGTQTVSNTPIALTFSHAYCWVTIKLSKLTEKTEVSVTAVSIENSNNTIKGVINKGSIDPKTGDVIANSAQAGSLVIDCNPVIDLPLAGAAGTTPSVFDFLVPPSMSADIQNSDIVIRVTTETTGGVKEVLSFPLNREHLNNANTNQYGFEKGKHNTYDIVYNNAEMILSLSDWLNVPITEPGLGQGVTGVSPITVTMYSYIPSEHKPAIDANKLTDHRLHTYLGEVADGNNGAYVTITSDATAVGAMNRWAPALKAEPFFPNLMITRNLAAGGGMIPWKDDNTGALLAKQACAECREGGYNDWRLPRIGEFYMLSYPDNYINGKEFWSATESDAATSYYCAVNNSGSYPDKAPKETAFYIRCVRDNNKLKPTL